MDPIALWQCCRGRRRLLSVPKLRQIELAGQSGQLASLVQCLGRLGYDDSRPNAIPSTNRRVFNHPEKTIKLILYLDVFEMYHRFDLTPFIRPNNPTIAPTALALTRLQLVEMPDEALSDLAALFIEFDVSLIANLNQIDASQISALCAEDWGWHKTVSVNLEQLIYFAEDSLMLAEKNAVIDRARRLKSSIDATPKSLRWQVRARLGESVHWYNIPVDLNTPIRPDMAMG
jgi:hypothetical protein